MAKSDYFQKLKDPRWQKKRLEILQRDDFTCQNCQSKNNELHVHHKYYIYGNDPWDYQNSALIVLCKECHEEEDYYKESSQILIRNLKKCGFSNYNIECLAMVFDELIFNTEKNTCDKIEPENIIGLLGVFIKSPELQKVIENYKNGQINVNPFDL